MKEVLEEILKDMKETLEELKDFEPKKVDDKIIKKGKENIKKSIDKSNLLICATEDNSLVFGKGIDILAGYGVLTERILEEFPEFMVKNAFDMAFKNRKGEK